MSNINKPAVKPILLGKKIILKPDKVPTIGSDSLVTSGALAEALQNKNVALNDSSDNIIPTGDIIIGRLGEDSAFYIINPNFLGTKWMKLETLETGKLYYDKFTHTYYTFQGYIVENEERVGYKFEPLVLPSIVKVTWQELKDLRDNSKLIPGLKYRITDYNCTTTQENTKSAGHQFDIVLLALSENKLAEEGWAMEHPADVWTVDFYDGDEGHYYYQCYVYETSEGVYNVVDIYTLLGMSDVDDYNDINVDNKTMTLEYVYEDQMIKENLTYNYFQNSNLSAWKVWYCLDNDKSRFAWADDSVDESVAESITYYGRTATFIYERNPSIDELGDYGWSCNENGAPTQNLYTATLTIIPGTTKAADSPGGRPTYNIGGYTPAHEGTNLPNGRGVIYRLIDEWNNNVPYDFKNILIFNETYNEYCYAIADFTNLNEDPTLNGTKVNSIHVLSNNNNVLKPVAVGGFVNNPLTNIILLNNNSIIGEIDNCVVSNGNPI